MAKFSSVYSLLIPIICSISSCVENGSASERKRRQVYRGEIHGQLPFEAKGMDNSVPTIDFSPTGTMDSPYSLERGDVEGLSLFPAAF